MTHQGIILHRVKSSLSPQPLRHNSMALIENPIYTTQHYPNFLV